MPEQSIHKALDLPSTYRVGIVVEGHIDVLHFRLRVMYPKTGGQEIVYARSVSWGAWTEIDRATYEGLALRIIGIDDSKINMFLDPTKS